MLSKWTPTHTRTNNMDTLEYVDSDSAVRGLQAQIDVLEGRTLDVIESLLKASELTYDRVCKLEKDVPEIAGLAAKGINGACDQIEVLQLMAKTQNERIRALESAINILLVQRGARG